MSDPASSPWRALGLAILSGALYGFGFVGFDLTPLLWVCFVPVLFALRAATPRRALWLGGVMGLVANFICYYWIVHLLISFAGLSLPLAVLGFALLSIYQGFILGPTLWLVLRARRMGLSPLLSLPLSFAALELLYPMLFQSFMSNGLYRWSVVTQLAELTGMIGLTALIAVVNTAFFELAEARVERRRPVLRRLAVPAAILGAALIFGAVRLSMIDATAAEAPKLRVGMVQTNLGARDKAERRDEFIERHREMTRALVAEHPDLDLVVWPESAYNRWIERKTTRVTPVTGGLGKPIIFGALTFDAGAEDGRYNTAILADAEDRIIGMFDKVELLAFGETIPFVETFPIIKTWLPRSSSFVRGTNLRHFRLPDGTSLLPMICYEDIIPSFVRRIWAADGPAELLVNVTNDSWYGDTHEPLIHLALATFRSIETRRALIRSTNTGISAFVDPAGRITHRTGQWTRETLVAEVPRMRTGTTVYMALGDWVGYLGAGFAAYVLIRGRASRGSAKDPGRSRRAAS